MVRQSTISTRRNVTLKKFKRNGKTAFGLIGPDGRELEAFSIFNGVLMSAKFNTRKCYCAWLADFYDYFFEAGTYLQVTATQDVLSRSQLLEIIDSWREYQVYGGDSDVEIVRAINVSLPSPRVSQSTANNKHAALGRFLALSEKIRQDSVSLANLSLINSSIDPMPLLAEFERHVKISEQTRSAMKENSMLAGVLGQGPKQMAAPIFPNVEGLKFDTRSVFPLECFEDFAFALRSYRDKTIVAFDAASGGRGSEGLQLLWEDIDIEAGTVRLVDPATRPNHPSYLALTPEEREKLSWKGRQTELTLLIEPYASMFFEFLELYHREEYYPHGRHGFVFQVGRNPGRGRPYFATDTKTRQQVFDTAAKAIGLSEHVKGRHSFRHAYGTYLLNYIPVSENEYGMPIGLVRLAMGHINVKSTAKYAVHDQDVLDLKIKLANSNVFAHGMVRSPQALKLGAVRAQIEKLKQVELGLMGEIKL